MLIGETKLGYTITELLGQGGFGSVYKAVKKNKAMETVRALKHISLPSRKEWTDIYNSMGNDMAKTDAYFDAVLQEILNEIRILADLTNKGVKNVVWYYENEIEDTPSPKHYDIYLLMEYLTALPSYIEAHEIKVKDVIKIGTDILTALVECHTRKIIHRDIKTDNIFISEDGDYKLGDFGVSKKLSDRSRATSMKGTPNYIAPEVYLGQEYDETVDLYSLGIVLYRLLNYNRNPFMPSYPASYNSEDEDKSFELRMQGQVPEYPAFATGELGDVILKSISNKDMRFKSAKEFKDALESAAKSLSNEELEKVVLENMLSGVDLSTFGSKNDVTQMAKDNISVSRNNSAQYSQSKSFSAQNSNSFSMNQSNSFSSVNEKSNKFKIVIPVAVVSVIIIAAGLFFALKGTGGSNSAGNSKSTNKIKNEWYTAPNGEKYYLDENGEPFKDTAKNINGKNYFFNSKGEIVTNDWFQYEGDYFYIDKNGDMVKNDFVDDGSGTWYYLGSDGKMLKNTFYDVNSETYFFAEDGKMKDDTLFNYGSSYYYAQRGGAIKKNGWCANNTYYADDEGKILINTVTPDGIKVDATGKRVIENKSQSSSQQTKSQQSQQTSNTTNTGNAGANVGGGLTTSVGSAINDGSVAWGDHFNYTETVYLDEFGEEGGVGKITIYINKVKEDGTQLVSDINATLEEIFNDARDRAEVELPYKYFELNKTTVSTADSKQVVIVVTGEIKYTDNQVEKIRYKVMADREHGSVAYEKVR